jgi:hypothetical protein
VSAYQELVVLVNREMGLDNLRGEKVRGNGHPSPFGWHGRLLLVDSSHSSHSSQMMFFG